ncbi:MAG: hypothetical protein HYY44_03030 [Deltaproteobacteria bacterium]|nr:hypothetical protein [Deltaproteobacteria bacterium]MBI4373482.1 hypothetical protein [Deltaproteobacteria bacterium]
MTPATRQLFEPLYPKGCSVPLRSAGITLFLIAAGTVAFTGAFESGDSVINIPLKFINFLRTGRLHEFTTRRFSERCHEDPRYASLYGYRDGIRQFLQVGLIAGGVWQHFSQNRKFVKGKGQIGLGPTLAWTALSLGMNIVVRMIADGAGNAKLRPTAGTSPWNPKNYRLEDFCTNLFVSTWSLAIFFTPFFSVGTRLSVNATEHFYQKIFRQGLPFFAREALPEGFVKPGFLHALFSKSTLGYLGLVTLFTGTASGIGTCMIRSSQEYADRSYYLTEFFRSYLSMMPSRLFLIGWMIATRKPLSVYAYNLPSLLLTIYPLSTPNSTKEAGAQKYRELAQDYLYASPEKKALAGRRLALKSDEIENGPFVKQWDEVQKIRERYALVN